MNDESIVAEEPKPKPMTVPIGLLVVGLLFFINGSLAALGMVGEWLQANFHFDANVFAIPIGLGLITGRRSSRRWAMFWICVGILIVGLATWSLLTGAPPGIITWAVGPWELHGATAVRAFVLSAAAVLGLMAWALYSKKASAYIESREAMRALKASPPPPPPGQIDPAHVETRDVIEASALEPDHQ